MSHVTSPFLKKTVYHSALREASPLTVRITSDPVKSKFQKNGADQFFIDFEYMGKEQQYIIETDEIRDQLRGLKGHMVEIIAKGGKDDATMEVYDAASPGTETPPPNRAAAPHRPPAQNERHHEAPPARQQSSQSAAEAAAACLTRARRNVMKASNGMLMALRAGHVARQTFEDETGRQLSDAHFQAACASIFIALDKSGVINDMPANPLPAKTTAPAARPPAQRPAEPPPERQREPERRPSEAERSADRDAHGEPPEDDDIPF